MRIDKIQNLSSLTGHLAVIRPELAYGLSCVSSDIGDDTLHTVNSTHVLQDGIHGFKGTVPGIPFLHAACNGKCNLHENVFNIFHIVAGFLHDQFDKFLQQVRKIPGFRIKHTEHILHFSAERILISKTLLVILL